MSDVRFAVRSLLKNPGFSAVVVLTLALGTGVNLAIFSVMDHTLLRRLPVPNPEQLVNLSSPGPRPGGTSADSNFGGRAEVFSYPLLKDLQREQTAFTAVAAHRGFAANLAFNGKASNDAGLLVSGSFFPVLGLQPALGRLLGESDDLTPGAQQVVVLAFNFWRTRFNGDPSILNQRLIVNGQPMTIVGVAPAAFTSTTLEHTPDVFISLSMAAQMLPDFGGFDDRRDHFLYLFARLKPGLMREDAERQMNLVFGRLINEVELPALSGRMEDAQRSEFAQRRLLLLPGDQGQRPDRDGQQRLALLLFLITGSVLLMACGNVANLLLARGVYRSAEFSLRMSLGAVRARLVRSLLIESAVLAVAGIVTGVVLANAAIGTLAQLLPGTANFRIVLDPALLVFTTFLTGGTVFLVGLYPAFSSTRADLTAALRASATASSSPTTARFRMGLMALQVALSLSLLVVAGLFAKSLLNVGRVELGIRPDNLMTFRINPELSGYTRERAQLLTRRIEDQLSALPGVVSVGVSTIPLLDGYGWSSNVTIDPSPASMDASTAEVGPGYFGTVGVPLVAGREFTPSDVAGAPKVAIVNEALVRAFNLTGDIVGRRMGLGAGNVLRDIEIIGVARDAHYSDVKSAAPPQFYLPYRQIQRFPAVNFYVRSNGSETALLAAVPQLLAQVDPLLPIENLRTMRDQVRAGAEDERALTMLAAAFAGLAVLLAAVGLYGVLSYVVAQRRREIGVRMALGAAGWRIAGLLFGSVARITVVGGVAGAAGAFALGRVAQSRLFGIDGADGTIIAAASAVVIVVAIGAACVPARRAARVDPITALRTE